MTFTEKEIIDFFKELGLETEQDRAEKLITFSKNTETKNEFFEPFEETLSLENENAILE